jgi:broad specificity phosphatase PhoE
LESLSASAAVSTMSPDAESTPAILRPMRRRLYLMRHGEVSYFQPDGRPVDPMQVPLNADGVEQARAAAIALRGIELDRVLTSGMPRTLETAAIVAPAIEAESFPELREIQGGRLSEIPLDVLEHEFVNAFRGVIPNGERFLRGESIGELFDRVLPALANLVADDTWNTALAVLHEAAPQQALELLAERTMRCGVHRLAPMFDDRERTPTPREHGLELLLRSRLGARARERRELAPGQIRRDALLFGPALNQVHRSFECFPNVVGLALRPRRAGEIEQALNGRLHSLDLFQDQVHLGRGHLGIASAASMLQ